MNRLLRFLFLAIACGDMDAAELRRSWLVAGTLGARGVDLWRDWFFNGGDWP